MEERSEKALCFQTDGALWRLGAARGGSLKVTDLHSTSDTGQGARSPRPGDPAFSGTMARRGPSTFRTLRTPWLFRTILWVQTVLAAAGKQTEPGGAEAQAQASGGPPSPAVAGPVSAPTARSRRPPVCWQAANIHRPRGDRVGLLAQSQGEAPFPGHRAKEARAVLFVERWGKRAAK